MHYIYSLVAVRAMTSERHLADCCVEEGMKLQSAAGG